MISVQLFMEHLNRLGFSDILGVPCSFLIPLVNYLEDGKGDLRYIKSVNEGEALSIAAGLWAANRSPLVFLQNSGLGNIINPLTSLVAPFQIPLLLLVTWRGMPGASDEPQHKVMGESMLDFLRASGVEYEVMSSNWDIAQKQITIANKYMDEKSKPYALIIQNFTFEDYEGAGKEQPEAPTRREVVEFCSNKLPSFVPIVATTGKTGRELYSHNHQSQNIYCVGAMGFANALALGVAIGSEKEVVVLDGDGALLMHLGNMATIGSSQAKLVHILIDNGSYESTGSQETISRSIDFIKIAFATGYKSALKVSNLEQLGSALDERSDLPCFIHVTCRVGESDKLPRPKETPSELIRKTKAIFKGA